MAMTFGEKAARVLRFMLAVRNVRIASAMAPYGFSAAELQEGWALMAAVGRLKLDAHAAVPDTSAVEQLDQWENRWFPIASVTLRRRFPAAYARLFKNLAQTEGIAVVVSVRTFLERLDQMAAGSRGYGADGPRAKAILEARGLTPAVVDQARALLESVGSIATVDGAFVADDPKALAKAEDDLWAWYLEWSQVARTAVRERGLLRQMGFLAPRKARGSADADAMPTPDAFA